MSISGEVADYLTGLEDPLREALEELCVSILAVDERVTGEIKWNAPSFRIREHFATTGVNRDGTLRLVLHAGAKSKPDAPPISVADPEGLLEWKGADRAILTVETVEDVRRMRAALQAILREWIAATQEGSA